MSRIRVVLMTIVIAAPIATIVVLAGRHKAAANVTAAPHPIAASPQLTAERAKTAARALMGQKSQWATQCGSAAAQAAAPSLASHHRVRVTFDPEGQVVSHHVEDMPGKSRAEVGDCLRDLTLDVQIEPADAPTTVSVMVALP